MAEHSLIEWTDATWNPVTGCSEISAGCERCYAQRLARRLQAMGNERYRNGTQVTVHYEVLDLPLRWKRPRMVFVNSMSDLFHEDVPERFIFDVLMVVKEAPRHVFQVLTKRSKRMAELASRLPWPENLWMGVTVERAEYLWRIEHLRSTPARVRFVSLEPLLGPLDGLDLRGIDWVIVGGESGPGARPMDPDWVRPIRDSCVSRGVPFFFKQWGGTRRAAAGRLLDGRTWDELPLAPGSSVHREPH